MSLKSSAAKALLCAVLAAGSMCGVAIRPDEIEKLLQLHNQTNIQFVKRSHDGDGNDPPVGTETPSDDDTGERE